MPSPAMKEFTEKILDRLAGTLDENDNRMLAAAVLDAFEMGMSVDEFFKWQESGKSLVDFLGEPVPHSYLPAWKEAAIAEDPSGVICGRCKKDNNWYDNEGWFYWYPLDASGKPDGLPSRAVCLSCLRWLGLPTQRGGMSWQTH